MVFSGCWIRHGLAASGWELHRRGCFGAGVRFRVLLELQVLQDFPDDILFLDERDDPLGTGILGADERIDLARSS